MISNQIPSELVVDILEEIKENLNYNDLEKARYINDYYIQAIKILSNEDIRTNLQEYHNLKKKYGVDDVKVKELNKKIKEMVRFVV